MVAQGRPTRLLEVLLVLATTTAARAQVHESAKLVIQPYEDDIEYGERLGSGLSAVDGFAWLGAPGESDTFASEGAIFRFRRGPGGWRFVRTLRAENPLQALFYGGAIAFDGEKGVAGCWYDATKGFQVGSALFLERSGTTWSEIQKEYPPPPRDRGDAFGYEVAMDGDRVLISASGDDDVGTNKGAAYVYLRTPTGWVLEQKLLPDHLPLTDWSNAGSVDLCGDLAVLGSAGERAFVFRRGPQGWVQEAVLAHPSGLSGEIFGYPVAIDGDTIAVGATVWDGGNRPGSVVIFQLMGQPGNWVPVQVLHASNALTLDRFGISLDLLGDRLLVGSYRSNLYNVPGNAYLFERESGVWKESAILASSDGVPSSFGTHVSLCESYALVGDPLSEGSVPGVLSGSAYVFDLPLGHKTCDGVPNSTQEPATMWTTGSLRADAGALDLWSDRLPPNQVGYFLLASEAGFVAGSGGSQGNLCLGGTIGRFGASLQSTGTDGTMHFQVDTDYLPLHPPQKFQPGETWHFQGWYRDHNPTSTSNFTDGLAITFR